MKTYKCIIIEAVEFEVEVAASNENEAKESAIDMHVVHGASDLLAVTNREVSQIQEVTR